MVRVPVTVCAASVSVSVPVVLPAITAESLVPAIFTLRDEVEPAAVATVMLSV